MKSVSRAFIADVEASAELAYEAVAPEMEVPVEEVYFSPACISVSRFIARDLSEKGYDITAASSRAYPEQTYDEMGAKHPLHWAKHRVIPHTFCHQEESRPTVLIDATWQQFLPEDRRSSDLPKVLIGRTPDFLDVLRSCGITKPGMLELWVLDPDFEFWHLGNDFVSPAALWFGNEDLTSS